MDAQLQHVGGYRENEKQVVSGMEWARVVKKEWVCVAL